MVIISYLATGEMVEWSITAVLKTAVPRGTGGSNPSLSANKGVNQQIMRFTPFITPNFRVLKNYRISFIVISDFICESNNNPKYKYDLRIYQS